MHQSGHSKQLGFSSHDSNNRMFQPVHLLQFADDAAVATSGKKKTSSCLTASPYGVIGPSSSLGLIMA